MCVITSNYIILISTTFLQEFNFYNRIYFYPGTFLIFKNFSVHLVQSALYLSSIIQSPAPSSTTQQNPQFHRPPPVREAPAPMPPLRLERVVLVDDRVAPPPVRDAPFFKPPNDFILANKPPFLLVVLVVAAAADDEDTAVLGSVRRLLLPTLWGVDGVDRYLVSQTWRKKFQKALVFGRSGHVRQNINNQDQNNGSYIDKMPSI
jgi:hypothetical protein